MTYSFITRPVVLLMAACLICVAAPNRTFAATGEMDTQLARTDGDVDANPHDLVQGSHVDGHVAFLKAELAITPAQEALWLPVAAAMREDVKNMQEAESMAVRKHRPESAVEYLENRSAFAALRAQGEARFLTAFRPLYNNLSTHQKQVADGVLIPRTPEE
jgi:hypothetical protein